MRVLLAASMGGIGHLAPVQTVAQACIRLGHEVAVLVPPALAPEATRAGLAVAVGADPPRTVVEGVWKRMRTGPPDPGLVDRELFAGPATVAMLGAARSVRDAFRPNLVVREPCEYSSAIAACEAGISQAQIAISQAAIERRVLAMVAPVIDRQAPGLAEVVAAAPYLSPFPATLDPSPWPDTRRFSPPESATSPLPEWWSGDDRPLVYVTFGSVVGHLSEAVGVYRCAIDAVAELPCRVLLTVGHNFDVSHLTPVPANTHVSPWVAQSDVLATASLVVCHGGSGTTLGALAAGVPLVVCPFFADQSANGVMVEATGAGVVVSGFREGSDRLRGLGRSDVGPLRDAIEEVLANPRYRHRTEPISAQMRAEPALDTVVADLIETA